MKEMEMVFQIMIGIAPNTINLSSICNYMKCDAIFIHTIARYSNDLLSITQKEHHSIIPYIS